MVLKTLCRTNIAIGALAALFLLPIPAGAFTLGAPRLLSRSGAPLHIQVPLVVEPGDGVIQAALSAPDVYTTLNHVYSKAFRNGNQVHVVSSGGASYIDIKGTGPARESAPVAIVLDIAYARGHVVRQFTVNLPALLGTGEKLEKDVKAIEAPANRKAAIPVAGTIPVSAIADLMKSSDDTMRNLNDRMGKIDSSIKGIAAAIVQTSAEIHSTDTAIRETHRAVIQHNILQGDELAWLLGTAAAGFLMGVALVPGRRNMVRAGMHIKLVGVGRKPIDSEFVRVVNDEPRALAYRFADFITGAKRPRVIEVRAIQQAPLEDQTEQVMSLIADRTPPAGIKQALAGVDLPADFGHSLPATSARRRTRNGSSHQSQSAVVQPT